MSQESKVLQKQGFEQPGEEGEDEEEEAAVTMLSAPVTAKKRTSMTKLRRNVAKQKLPLLATTTTTTATKEPQRLATVPVDKKETDTEEGDDEVMLSIKYEKMDPITHILKRPDTYVGPNETTETLRFVANTVEGEESETPRGKKTERTLISFRSVIVNSVLVRIFVEILSNAVDNVFRTREKTAVGEGNSNNNLDLDLGPDESIVEGEASTVKSRAMSASAGAGNIKCSYIRINVNEETGETSIVNDGLWIPIETGIGGLYNHTLIFGHLMTSSNYNDTEFRRTSGRNGLGAKLTNVYSAKLRVTGTDPQRKLKFEQTWTRNMRETEGPKITPYHGKTGSTRVEWIPDFSCFPDLDAYTADIISVFRKLAVDTAMLTKLRVDFNGEKFFIRDLLAYSKLYSIEDVDVGTGEGADPSLGNTEHDCSTVASSGPGARTGTGTGRSPHTLHSVGRDNQQNMVLVVVPAAASSASELAVGEKLPGHISFVNGIHTPLGGKHVDAWATALCDAVAARVSTKTKKLRSKDVRKCLRFFVNVSVVNPSFESQNKFRLVAPAVQVNVTPGMVAAVASWPVVKNKLRQVMMEDEQSAMKSTERTSKFKRIPGHDRANLSGGKRSQECTLIVCEGKSAAGTAVVGMQVGLDGKKGPDFFGLYAARGKVMNARRASTQKLAKNKEVQDIIQAIGLRVNTDYSDDNNFRKLSYGRLLIMTDADTDGLHITGLLLNLFHRLFPSLLRREPSFVVTLQTPIVRVLLPHARGGDLTFYDEDAYRRYAEAEIAAGRVVKKKYYKGLGTLTKEDIRSSFGKKLIFFHTDSEAEANMEIVFGKGSADARKQWIVQHDPDMHAGASIDATTDAVCTMSLSHFLNTQVVKFSVVDCERSLPSCIDGFKKSQRKIFHTADKRGLRGTRPPMKVAQLGGATAEETNYPNGENNLLETTTKMAARYVGSNNLPVLLDVGNFGSRLEGGSDAANGRYTFTKIDPRAEYVFLEDDKCILDYIEDDGDVVEPKYFAPIIPMILVNGCHAGIATGWSCSIPCFSPGDVIHAVREWIDCTESGTMPPEPDMTPWYAGHAGEIIKAVVRRPVKPNSSGACASKRKGQEGAQSIRNKKMRTAATPSEPGTIDDDESVAGTGIQKEDADDGLHLSEELPGILDAATDTGLELSDAANAIEEEVVFLSQTEYTQIKPNVVRITELPVGVWTNRYRDDLEKLLEEKKIRGFVKQGTEETIDFTVTTLAGLDEKTVTDVERTIKPVRAIRTNNMVLFDRNGRIRRFDTPGQIIHEFCTVRLSLYVRRRQRLIASMERELVIVRNKHHFLNSILAGKLVLKDRSEADIIREMGQPIMLSDGSQQPMFSDVDNDGFRYLLNIPMRNCTLEKMRAMQGRIAEIQEALDNLAKSTPRDIWRSELGRLAKHL